MSGNQSRSRFPVDRPYLVRDPATGLIHTAQAYDDGTPLPVHATRCDVELGWSWPVLENEPITCITCMAGK